MSTLITHTPRTATILSAGPLAGQTLNNITIKEIVGMLPVTAMRQGNNTIFGLISFHGKTVPVIDLRMGTSLLPLPQEEQICILAGETGQHAAIILGALVESEAAAYELVLGTTH